MRFTLRRAGGLSWTARAAVAVVLVGGTAAATAGIAAAQVRPASPRSTAAIVVHVATRAPFGKMLTTDSGLSLYINPAGCSASCLTIWPPLFMPKGKTVPKGETCLGTVKVGTKLQVTYKGQKLYSFTGDSGTSVNGNGLAGFTVAKVSKCTTG
jgi:predicted lipoprotein with Yx(FWY)xxD motif